MENAVTRREIRFVICENGDTRREIRFVICETEDTRREIRFAIYGKWRYRKWNMICQMRKTQFLVAKHGSIQNDMSRKIASMEVSKRYSE